MRKLLCVLLLGLAAGCVTYTDLVREKDDGTARRYPVTVDQAWDITKMVFHWVGADRVEEHRSEGYLLASDTDDRQDYGTLMAAWVERDPDGVTRVTVRTRSRLMVNPATLLSEEGFHRRFVQAMRIVQEGKPLPDRAPE